jgi:hypothetical protein
VKDCKYSIHERRNFIQVFLFGEDRKSHLLSQLPQVLFAPAPVRAAGERLSNFATDCLSIRNALFLKLAQDELGKVVVP